MSERQAAIDTLNPAAQWEDDGDYASEHLGSESYAFDNEIPPIADKTQFDQVHRSMLAPILFLIPVLFSGVAYLGGGIPILTDLAFVIVSVLCIAFFIQEIVTFRTRRGIGSLLIYGGVFIWFCHDYLQNWLGHRFSGSGVSGEISVEVVSRAGFYHCLFIEMMLVAYRWHWPRWPDRLLTAVPEPLSSHFYLYIVIAGNLFGLSAFFFCTDIWPVAVAKACLWFLPGWDSPQFLYGRTGNINFNFGGYLAQILQVGTFGGVLGAFYAIMIARRWPERLIGLISWAFWVSYSIPGLRRGNLAFMGVPVIGLVFMKYMALASLENLKPKRIRGIIATSVVAFAVYYAIAWESHLRNNWQDIQLTSVGGNSMFSEGLQVWAIIPSSYPFAFNTYFGAELIRPIPDSLFDLAIGPIPRAIWATKPIDPFSLWYSATISHDNRGVLTGGIEGTTVSSGAVGYWYYRYGPIGVIEGGLFWGILMGIGERALRRAGDRPMGLMMALGYATFIFRCYRDLWWHNLYPVLIGGVVLGGMIYLVNGGRRMSDHPRWEPSGSTSLE